MDALAGPGAVEPLTEREQLALRIAYERAAFPHRFTDVRRAAPFFRAAAALPGLPDEKRAAIEVLAAASDERLHRSVLEVIDGFRREPLKGEDALSRGADVREGNFRFARAELHARAIWALRGLLSPGERAKVRGLNEYDRLCLIAGNSWWQE